MNKEQAAFLSELQKEMTTQNHVGQASPRFWVVGDYEWRPVADGAGDILTIFCFAMNENRSMEHEEMAKELIEYLEEDIDDESGSEKLIDELKQAIDGESHLPSVVEEALDELGFEYSVQEECYEHFIRPNTMFLTLKEAKQHIQRNAHNYGKDAHPYAMTALRSPEVSKVFEILETVDWETVGNLL